MSYIPSYLKIYVYIYNINLLSLHTHLNKYFYNL